MLQYLSIFISAISLILAVVDIRRGNKLEKRENALEQRETNLEKEIQCERNSVAA